MERRDTRVTSSDGPYSMQGFRSTLSCKGDVVKVVSPIGQLFAAEASDATWRVDITGQTIGFLSNGKANSAELLAALQRRIVARHDVAGVVWANKSLEAQGPGMPAPPDIVDRLSSGVVAVLAASGD